MKAGRAWIGIYQKMHIKNLRGQWGPIKKKLDSFTLETSRNHLIRNFMRNGRVRVKFLSHETSILRPKIFSSYRSQKK